MKKIEEIEFEVTSKSSQLKRFLTKPMNERMPFEVIEVVQILKVTILMKQKINTFQRYFNSKSESHNFSVMPTFMTLKTFQPGEVIYKQGDQSDEMYVIIEGKITVGHGTIEFLFGPGTSFGEIEILYHSPVRYSTAKCVSQIGCECVVITRESVLMNLNNDINIKEYYGFFSRQPYFEGLSEFDRRMLSSKVDQVKYQMGEYVVKEGTLIDRIYWVQRGKISVSRSIDLFDNGSLKSTIFNIDTIEQSDTFGEYYALKKQLTDASLHFQNIGSCFTMNTQEILRISPILESIFLKHARKYPTNEQILEIYEVQVEITAKKNLKLLQIQNTHSSKTNYKKSKHEFSRALKFKLPQSASNIATFIAKLDIKNS